MSTRRPQLLYPPSPPLWSTSCIVTPSMTPYEQCAATTQYRETPQPKPSTPPFAPPDTDHVYGLGRAMTPMPSFILPAGPPLLKTHVAALASEKCFFQSPGLPLCSWCPPPACLDRRGPKSIAPPLASGLTSGFPQPQPECCGRDLFVTERSRRVWEGHGGHE